MTPEQLAVVRRMHAALSALLEGGRPEPVAFDNCLCPELDRLAVLVERLIGSQAEADRFIGALAEGRLDVAPPAGSLLLSPFKHLHAHLKHLLWLIDQVSNGDLHQRVDFMGDFSTAFNRMIEALREKERIEAALKASEDKYRSLYESMREGLALHQIVYDADDVTAVDYRILEVNPAFEEITTVAGSRAAGALASELYAVRPPPNLEIYERVARTGSPETFEMFCGPAGRHLLVSVFSPAKGLVAAVFSDISARKSAERDRLGRERLKGALETAGGVCHELNQPLMAASGYTELLLMDIGPDHPVYDKLVKIKESVARMTRITQKLAGITRYENRDYAGGTKILDIDRSSGV